MMTNEMKCPYCEKTTKPIELSEHIKNEHGKQAWIIWVDKILAKAAKTENFGDFGKDESESEKNNV